MLDYIKDNILFFRYLVITKIIILVYNFKNIRNNINNFILFCNLNCLRNYFFYPNYFFLTYVINLYI